MSTGLWWLVISCRHRGLCTQKHFYMYCSYSLNDHLMLFPLNVLEEDNKTVKHSDGDQSSARSISEQQQINQRALFKRPQI